MKASMSEVMTENDCSSFKPLMPQPSACLPEVKIKEHGKEVSGLPLLENSDDEDGYFSDTEGLWNEFAAELALTEYNKIHHTDYKLEERAEFTGYDHLFKNADTDWAVIHVQFAANSSEASDGHSLPKFFFAELLKNFQTNEYIVTSCHFLDGPSTGCRVCDRAPLITCIRTQSFGCKEIEEDTRFPNAALAHYNLNNNEDYELVGDIETYYSIEEEFVCHCNFRAKRKTGGDGEESLPELFFAELQQLDNLEWEVTCCFKIEGCKTTAGCYLCRGSCGKDVVHPMSGFRHGLTRLCRRST